MRATLRVAALIMSLLAAAPALARGSHAIRGHVTKSGTYVAPTRATNPNGTRRDNFSSKGNFNPMSGRIGTKDPSAPKRRAR